MHLDPLPAGSARHLGQHRVFADLVPQGFRNPCPARRPPMLPTPSHERGAVQRQSFFGEVVFETRRRGVVLDALQNAVLDEPVEPARERRAGRAVQGTKLFEATRALEGVAQDQERPAIAEDAESTGNGTAGNDCGDRRHRAHCMCGHHRWQSPNTIQRSELSP
jgi:hypothetical protein